MSCYCTETKEAVDEKVNSKRVEFPPHSLCTSAIEIDTESDLNHENVSLLL